MSQRYYDHPYETTFTADVTDVIAEEERLSVFLDTTLFFPEGGGQPADRGTLDGFPVVDVQRRDRGIAHVLALPAEASDSAYACLKPGKKITGTIDWPWRYRFMQHHTGQHIISGVLFRLLGAATLSVRLGETRITIEAGLPSLSPEDIGRIEDEANRIIRLSLPISAEWYAKGEELPPGLRRTTGKTDDIRIVRIGDYDATPCGGIHVVSTDEVKLAFCVGTERIRGNVRLIWAVGDQAVEARRAAFQTLNELSAILSASPDRVLEESRRLLVRVREAEKNHAVFKTAAAEAVAGLMIACSRVTGLLEYRFSGVERGFIRMVVEAARRVSDLPVCVVNVLPGEIEWVIGNSDPGFEFSAVKEWLLEPIGGRGGGKGPIWQGTGNAPEGVDLFCRRWRETVER